ncbi:MAG: small basic protein [Candidatus Omnitrophica bacterium]|nr:small basic protein [Candidatus Omnitrophota bacterium]
MSIHPSLTISEKDKKQRSVLKRTERIRAMSEKGKWIEGDMVYGLPKLKTVRIKIKKEKAEKVETAATPGATAEAAAPASKEAPAGKSAAKSQEKK